MKSRTAVLFPGLDALFVTAKLKQWGEVPFIQEKLLEASQYLSKITGKEENLLEFIRNNRRLHIADFDRTLVVLTTLQVAIASEVEKIFNWDIVQGCSHGDIARNVLCNVITFKEAIEILWKFSELRQTCPKGYTASVRSFDTEKINSLQLQWLRDKGANLSTWSESHGTIGGDSDFIDNLSVEGASVGLKIKPILSYPVHSEAMRPIISELFSYQELWNFKNPTNKIFSSVWLKFIDNGKELFEEGIAGATNPVRWVETLHHLNQVEDIGTFINIGPSNTLTGWLLDSDEFNSVKVLDAWDLLFGDAESELSQR